MIEDIIILVLFLLHIPTMAGLYFKLVDLVNRRWNESSLRIRVP